MLKPIHIATKLFRGPSDMDRSRRALTWLMFGVVKLNCDWLRDNPDSPALYDSGVLYKAEQGTENWQDIPTTLEKGFGDCEDLAMWRCAELREIEGVAAMPYISWRFDGQGTIYHALVRWPNGLIEDPSRALGMLGSVTRKPTFIGVDRT